MSNLFSGLKTFVVGVIASVSAVVTPSASLNPQNIVPQTSPSYLKVASESVKLVQVASSTPKESPLTLNGENYIYVQGKYSYLGQEIKYLFLVPRKGGNFGGSIEGACQAQANGDYEGGNGGKFSGSASGECNMFGYKLKGTAKYSGKLYPDSKTVEVSVDNSPVNGFKINYN